MPPHRKTFMARCWGRARIGKSACSAPEPSQFFKVNVDRKVEPALIEPTSF